MPIFKFVCPTCGLSSSKRASKDTSSVRCDCGSTAYLSDSAGGLSVGFSSKVGESMKAQSTGLESFDLDYDRVIGEDAKEKWETIYQRRRDKWDLIEQHQVQGRDLVRMKDQTYSVQPQMSNALRENRVSSMETIKNQEVKES